jgi:adenylate cyclase class 2
MRSASKAGLRKSAGRAPEKRNTEIEVKLRIGDERRLLRQLARLKAKLTRARVHEMNTLYDTPDGSLARHGRLLRLRVERPAARAGAAGKAPKISGDKSKTSAVLTFKGPAKRARTDRPEPYKIREEHEVRISNHEAMPRILEALGVRPWFRYEKFRSTFELPRMRGLHLSLDETPIGLFLEVEGERREIDRAARRLGFATSDYINKSYGALFAEVGGSAVSQNEPVPFSGVPDMLFPR